MTTLILPVVLREEIASHAREAFPLECCGLLEGMRNGSRIVVSSVHPARNLSQQSDRFEIDPADHIRHLRAARERGTAIVGCYHSHPNGCAQPSAHDFAGAGEEGFAWVIAAAAADGRFELNAFEFDGAGFVPVSLSESATLDPARALRV